MNLHSIQLMHVIMKWMCFHWVLSKIWSIVVWIICRYTNEFSVLLYLLQYLCVYASECHSVSQLLRHLYLTDLELHICIHFIVVLFIPVISSAMHASCFYWFYFLINNHVKLYWFLLYQSIPVFCCWSSTKFFPTTEMKNACHWFNMKKISKVDKR